MKPGGTSLYIEKLFYFCHSAIFWGTFLGMFMARFDFTCEVFLHIINFSVIKGSNQSTSDQPWRPTMTSPPLKTVDAGHMRHKPNASRTRLSRPSGQIITTCKFAWLTTELARDLVRTFLRSHYTRDV